METKQSNNDSEEHFTQLCQSLACRKRFCRCQKYLAGNKCNTHCPAHEDKSPSLSVKCENGSLLFHCHAGCDQNQVLTELRKKDLWPMRKSGRENKKISLTVEALAEDKGLSADFLIGLGLVSNCQGKIEIPYRNVNGEVVNTRYRTALKAGEGSTWPKRTRLIPYGLDRLEEAREGQALILVEGESDCWTLWKAKLPALGFPGAQTGYVLESRYLDQITTIYVFKESDGGGDAFVKSVRARMSELAYTGEVRILEPPDGINDVNAWYNADPDRFVETFKSAMDQSGPIPLSDSNSLRKIIITERHLREITDDVWDVLQQVNDPPFIFQAGGWPVDLMLDPKGTPRIRTLSKPALKGIIDRLADFIKMTDRGPKPARPPLDVLDDLINSKENRLPVLEGIVRSPIFSATGELSTTPGYQSSTLRYFHPGSSFNLATVPGNPSQIQIKQARDTLLDDLLGDFPFVESADLTNALAPMLLPFIRLLVDGPTPLHLIESPAPGNGKSILASVIAIPGTGGARAVMVESRLDDEWRKQLTAKLMQLPQMVLIDNLGGRLDSPSFAAALTSEIWEDRELGYSRMVTLPVVCTWLATGNNPDMSVEMARRTVPIRLDSGVEQPWRRNGFKHPLPRWAVGNRAELVGACLTLVRAWVASGKPKGQETLGSYESYAEVLGGIFRVADIPDFLKNLDRTYDQVDQESGSWLEFCQAWWDEFNETLVSSQQLFNMAVNRQVLLDICSGSGDSGGKIRLGKALSKMRDRVFGQFQISSGSPDSHNKIARYHLKITQLRDVRGVAVDPDVQKTFNPIISEGQSIHISEESADYGSKQNIGASDIPHLPAIPATDPWNDYMKEAYEFGDH